MGKKLKKFLDILFGKSPTDLQVIIPIFVLLLIKIGSNNNSIKEIGYQIKLLNKNLRGKK